MPFSNSLKLELGTITSGSTLSIRLYAADDRQQFDLSSKAWVVQEGALDRDLSGAALPAGMYILRLWVNSEEPVSLKFIKQQE